MFNFFFLFLFLCTFCFAAHAGVASDDKNSKRNVKPKPITLPVDAKPPRERKYFAFNCSANSFLFLMLITFYIIFV